MTYVTKLCDMNVSASVSAFSNFVSSTFGCGPEVSVSRQTIPTPDSIFLKVRTDSGQLTELRQTESGQTDTGQKIRTESGQHTDTGQDFPENPDKNETRTGHGLCCPPTSGTSRLNCNFTNFQSWCNCARHSTFISSGNKFTRLHICYINVLHKSNFSFDNICCLCCLVS